MISHLLVDADGMLIKSQRVSTRLHEEFGVPLEDIAPFFENEFAACKVGSADLKKELSPYLQSWEWEGSVDDFLAYWFDEEYNVIQEEFLPFFEELREEGIGVGLATNNEKYRLSDLLEHRGLGDWFDFVFSSSSIGAPKSDRAFFESALEELGADPAEVLFWDNDEANISTAEGLDIRAHVYTGFSHFKKTTTAVIEE